MRKSGKQQVNHVLYTGAAQNITEIQTHFPMGLDTLVQYTVKNVCDFPVPSLVSEQTMIIPRQGDFG